MSGEREAEIRVGATLVGERGRKIGTVDAVFVDYLLVRTAGVLPVDLYVPRPEITIGADRLWVSCGPDEAYRRWHRPLKKAPHAD